MIAYDPAAMTAELLRDEVERLRLYQDSVGKWTIGVGHNLSDKGVSPQASRFLLGEDLHDAETDLDRHVPWWRELSDRRQRGLLNMCFNMGWPTLSGFHTTLGHLAAGRYDQAAASALHSTWAHQVGARAIRIAAQFREG